MHPDGDVDKSIPGWIKVGNAVMQATDSLGVAHDVVEHSIKDTGSKETAVREELEAFGRLVYVRFERSSTIGRESIKNDAHRLSVNIKNFLPYLGYYGYLLDLDVKYLRIHKNLRPYIEEFQNHWESFVLSSDPDEREEDFLDRLGCSRGQLLRSFAYFINKGYIDAVKKYSKFDVYYDIFLEIQKHVKKIDSLIDPYDPRFNSFEELQIALDFHNTAGTLDVTLLNTDSKEIIYTEREYF